MWENEDLDSPLQEGNVLDIADESSVRLYNEIVKVHCFICGEQFIGPKDRAGLFILGHKNFHLWEVDFADMGGI